VASGFKRICRNVLSDNAYRSPWISGEIDPDRFRTSPGRKGKRLDRWRGFFRVRRIVVGRRHGMCGRKALVFRLFRLRNQCGRYPDDAGDNKRVCFLLSSQFLNQWDIMSSCGHGAG
jgi:hypothetical protein